MIAFNRLLRTARIALDNRPRSCLQLFSWLLHFQRPSGELENQKTKTTKQKETT